MSTELAQTRNWRWYQMPVLLDTGRQTVYEYRGKDAAHARRRCLDGYRTDVNRVVACGYATRAPDTWNLFEWRNQ